METIYMALMRSPQGTELPMDYDSEQERDIDINTASVSGWVVVRTWEVVEWGGN